MFVGPALIAHIRALAGERKRRIDERAGPAAALPLVQGNRGPGALHGQAIHLPPEAPAP